MALQPGTNKQNQENSILDHFSKQVYLGNGFVYALADTEITTVSETPLLLLLNPIPSGVAFPNALSLFLNHRKLVCLTASQNCVLRFYLNPTGLTGGTTEAPLNLRTGAATLSVATLIFEPTGTITGTLFDILASTPGQPDASDRLAILDPGKSMLVTAQASSTTTFIGAALEWFEL